MACEDDPGTGVLCCVSAWADYVGRGRCGRSRVRAGWCTACGEERDDRPNPQSAASGAVVYFIENDAEFTSTPKPTTRMGIDGRWVGATHGNSYLFMTVDPGEHHLCASWQKNP